MEKKIKFYLSILDNKIKKNQFSIDFIAACIEFYQIIFKNKIN